MNHKSLLRALALLFAFTLVAAACGDDSDDDTSTDTTEAATAEETTDDTEAPADDDEGEAMEDEGGLSGEIVISGSSTVEPISVRVAEDYKNIEPGVNISVSGPGTGDGFKLFCAGDTDVSDASRQIKDEEAEDCAANGIEYVELKVGVDGIAVMTSEANTAVECLSFGDLYALVGPESAGFTSWADANDIAGEIGNGGLPDADLVISAPGTESGTYDSFVEIVLEDFADERGQDADARPDYSSAADDNVIIETIASNDTSFGWVGFAFAVEASGVKLIEVSEEAGGDCVAPTPETIASNEYPIARDLFIYVNKAKAADSEALVSFIDHYMGFGLDTAASDVGYVALTDESKGATRDAWSGR
ncbi:MAG: substrate-binding domain-containing protein [Actinomycetota bacterium]